MIQKITKYLADYNFTSCFKPDLCNKYYIYSGYIDTNRYGNIEIELFFKKDILTFPIAIIGEKSINIFKAYHFPHMSKTSLGLDLCYHDNSIVFDTTNIPDSIKFVMNSLKQILDTVQEDDMNEIIPEFNSYWDIHKTYFCNFENDIPSYVIQDGDWLRETKVYNENCIPIFFIERIPNIQGINWPPKTHEDIIEWIQDDAISKEIKRKQKLFLDITLIIYTQNEKQLFGIHFIYQNEIKKSKHKSRTQKKQFLNKYDTIRFWVENVTRKNLLQSNLNESFPDLSDYDIALVGGGTIGSNLLQQLIRFGAGFSIEHKIAIIDNDDYMPENYSRHILSFSSFGKNKALELKKSILTSNPLINIESFSDTISKYSLDTFNIIIDTTGEENVTDFINKMHKSLDCNTVLIISWIKTDGKEVNCLIIPDTKATCHECFKHSEFYFRKDIPENFPKRNSCSSVYVPFPIIVSQQAASLTSRVLLDFVNNKIHNTMLYTQDLKTGLISYNKIEPYKDCPICSEN